MHFIGEDKILAMEMMTDSTSSFRSSNMRTASKKMVEQPFYKTVAHYDALLVDASKNFQTQKCAQ